MVESSSMSHKTVYFKKPTQSLLLITHQTGKLPILEKIPNKLWRRYYNRNSCYTKRVGDQNCLT